MGLTRREWLKTTLAVAGVGVFAAACSDDDPEQRPRVDTTPNADTAPTADTGPGTDAPAPDGANQDMSTAETGGDLAEVDSASPDTLAADVGAKDCQDSAISSNHGHALTVPAADVEAGVERTYSIQGAADHRHDVTLSAANFAQMRGGQSVTLSSTSASGHTHSVAVTCA
ncbi:MAG: hypothetical protein JRH20_17385 [Deltaproteobacteria bacterium]|nr:hypothetical protein [Deltaproteobacteria bacterium]